MTTDKHSPDPRFFNEDGSIKYDEALAAGRAAHSMAVRDAFRAPRRPERAGLVGRLMSALGAFRRMVA